MSLKILSSSLVCFIDNLNLLFSHCHLKPFFLVESMSLKMLSFKSFKSVPLFCLVYLVETKALKKVKKSINRYAAKLSHFTITVICADKNRSVKWMEILVYKLLNPVLTRTECPNLYLTKTLWPFTDQPFTVKKL